MVPPLFKGRRAAGAAHDSSDAAAAEGAPAAAAGNGGSAAAASSTSGAPAAILRVQLLRARGLAAMDRNGTSDPFVIVSIPGASARRGNSDYRRRSAVRRQTCEPEWSGKDEALFDFDIAPEWLAGAAAGSREASAEPELERSDVDEPEPAAVPAAKDPHLLAPLATPRPKPSRRISGAAGKILTAPVRIGARGAAAGARGAVAGARAVGRRRRPRPMRNPGGSATALQSPAGPQVGALEFVVWDKDKWTANDYMGEVSLPIEDWCKGDCAWESQEPMWLPLVSSRRSAGAEGQIQVRVGFAAVPGSPPLDQVYASLLASIHAVEGAPVRSVPADQSVGMVEPGEAFLDDGLDSGDESEEMEELASDTDGESATDEEEATTTDGDSDAGIFDEHFKSVVRSSPAPLTTAEPTPGEVDAAAAAPPAPPLSLPEAQQPPRGKFRRRLTRGISSRGVSGTTTPLTGDEGQPEPRKTRKRIKGPRKPRTRRSKNDEYSFRAAGSDIIGIVQMEIKSASDLPRWKNSLGTGFDMDPMVVASFSEKIWRTRVQRHTLNPVFDQKLIFHVRRHEAHWTTKLAVYDWDRLSSHDHVGGAEVRVAELIEAAPKPDPKTQLFPEDEDGQRPMQRFELDLTSGGAKQESVGAKHRPKLIVEAKFTPYAALRQRFWRQMLHNYDTNDSKTISSLELASMLDSLGSTLNAQTVNDFWARAGKTPDVDELTFDEAVTALEAELNRPWEEKRAAESHTSASSGATTPALLEQQGDGMDFSGPNAPATNEAAVARLAVPAPLSSFEPPAAGEPGNAPSVRPLYSRASSSSPGTDALSRDMSQASLGSGTSSDGVKAPVRGASGSSSTSASKNEGSDKERVILLKSCPMCHMPRLKRKAEVDIITHLAVCASQDWRRVDTLMVSNFVTASQAQKKWYTKVLTKISQGQYKIGADSANIIVQDRETGELLEEKMAVYVRLGIRLLYRGASSRMEGQRIKRMLYNMSLKQGVKFNSPASAREIGSFIAFHRLDMSEVADPLESFRTFNEFFYRKLKPDARPNDEPDNPRRLVSGADCRMHAFESVSDSKQFWIKGRHFTVPQLLGETFRGRETFTDGPLAIFRLAPQDYHRYHCPFDGTVKSIQHIPGEYFTVNPQAIRSVIDVYVENVRTVIEFETTHFGTVFYVCIGAMMVGSIELTVKQGDTLRRGDEVGYFAFGGSTILLVFEKGSVTFDDDILESSRAACESLVKVGHGIGRTAGSDAAAA